MRIDELIGYKDSELYRDYIADMGSATDMFSKLDAYGRFLGKLRDMGFQNVGKPGAYGVVMTNPQLDYAVKIFRTDPGYMAFVGYAQAHQDNPYMPQFRGKFMQITEERYVVRMELLKPVPAEDTVLAALRSLAHSYEKPEFDKMDLSSGFFANAPGLSQIVADLFVDDPVEEEFFLKHPGLAQTMEALNAVRTARRLHWDLNTGNILQRADGHLVIVDPFSIGV